MANYNKIGLLVLNDDHTKFLMCESKFKNGNLYLMPGGQVETGESDKDCLKREIMEELSCEVNESSLEFLGEYEDIAGGHTDKTVAIRLYKGELVGDPTPSDEVVAIAWVGKEEMQSEMQTPITKNKIVPDLVNKGILK